MNGDKKRFRVGGRFKGSGFKVWSQGLRKMIGGSRLKFQRFRGSGVQGSGFRVM